MADVERQRMSLRINPVKRKSGFTRKLIDDNEELHERESQINHISKLKKVGILRPEATVSFVKLLRLERVRVEPTSYETRILGRPQRPSDKGNRQDRGH